MRLTFKVKERIMLSLLLVYVCGATALNAQVTIGSGNEPVSGSLLDLKQTTSLGVNSDKGLGLPRVSLRALNDLYPCMENPTQQDKSDHVGLIVYNVNDIFCESLYVWNGENWDALSAQCAEPLYLPNSYMLKPGNSLKFPINKVFAVWREFSVDLPRIDLMAQKMTVEVYWKDDNNQPIGAGQMIESVTLNGTGEYALIEVKSGSPTANGNALIALRMGSKGDNTDPIRWSWHIWVTDYDPQAGAITYNNGIKTTVFMDRNLGALMNNNDTDENINKSYGLQYQWGRKDPLPGRDNSKPNVYPMLGKPFYNAAGVRYIEDMSMSSNGDIRFENIHLEANLQSVLENPLVMYRNTYNPSGQYIFEDWYSLARPNDYLWSTEKGKKGVFDPCPKGWRVPVSGDKQLSPWYFAPVESNRNDARFLNLYYEAECFGDDMEDLGAVIECIKGVAQQVESEGITNTFSYYPSIEDALLSDKSKGMVFNIPDYNLGIWPTAGHREGPNSMGNVQENLGYYWTANIKTGTNYVIAPAVARAMGEDTYSIAPTAMDYEFSRMTAASVRCVKE